jgi:hypothetical protein
LQGVNVRKLLIPVVSTATVAGLPYCYASDDAGLAAEMMGQYHADSIAVRDETDRNTVIGIITARSILHFYSQARQKEQDYQSPNRTRRMLVQGRSAIQSFQRLFHTDPLA